MSRSAAAFEYAPSNDVSNDAGFGPSEAPTWAEDKNPTRPLPVFRLEEEARRLDRAAELASIAAMRCDEDSTVTVSAADNRRLLASVFPGACASDDEPTLDAPLPSSPSFEAIAAQVVLRPVRVTARPPALRALVITRPAPVSPSRLSVTPAAVISDAAVAALPSCLSTPAPSPAPLAFATPPSGLRRKITAEMSEAEGRRRRAATLGIRLPKPTTTTYVVAGLWAMAFSLIAVLMFMVTSA